jgi:hypothetical protein
MKIINFNTPSPPSCPLISELCSGAVCTYPPLNTSQLLEMPQPPSLCWVEFCRSHINVSVLWCVFCKWRHREELLACEIKFHIHIQNGNRMKFRSKRGDVPLDSKQMKV